MGASRLTSQSAVCKSFRQELKPIVSARMRYKRVRFFMRGQIKEYKALLNSYVRKTMKGQFMTSNFVKL